MIWKVSDFAHLALPNFLKLGNAALELCLQHTIFIGLNRCPQQPLRLL